MKIIIDAMGGDNAPLEIVRGALSAHSRFGCDIVLAGDEAAIRAAAARCGAATLPQGVTLRPTTETVEMCDDPATVFRRKKDTSMGAALTMLRDGEGDAVVSAGSSLVFSFISMKTNAVNQQAAQAGNNASMKSMMIISPLISLWIGFSMPAALCLYWIAQNLLSMVQEFICGKLLKKDYEKAAAARAEQERLEKEEEKEERRRKAEERARRIEEAKLNKGKKKKTEKKHDEDEDKIPGSVKEHSRVGLRQYARGRAYDPYRYSEEGPTAYPGEAPIFPPRSDSRALKREAHEIEEELREIHTDEAIEDAILEEKALEAPVQEETEVVSAGEESEAEDDTDKTKE